MSLGPGSFLCAGNSAPSPVIRILAELATCCLGAAEEGPHACTCWEPVYDLEQQPVQEDLAAVAGTREKACDNCAYRAGSPEREGDDRYQGSEDGDLERFARDGVFWCHQGMRKPVLWRHRLGIEVAADSDAYEPPMVRCGPELVPFKADGTPGERCAGWAALRRQHADAVAGIAGMAHDALSDVG